MIRIFTKKYGGIRQFSNDYEYRKRIIVILLLFVIYFYKAFLIGLSKKYRRMMVSLLIDHINLRYMLHNMSMIQSSACRKCGTEYETTIHIMYECTILTETRRCLELQLLYERLNCRIKTRSISWPLVLMPDYLDSRNRLNVRA